MIFFREGLGIFWGAGLRFFRVRLGIFREAGLTFFREGLRFFREGLRLYSGRVEIFSGGVEIIFGKGWDFFGRGWDYIREGLRFFREGLRLYSGRVEIFSGRGGGGVKKYWGGWEIFRGVKKYSGGLRIIQWLWQIFKVVVTFSGGVKKFSGRIEKNFKGVGGWDFFRRDWELIFSKGVGIFREGLRFSSSVWDCFSDGYAIFGEGEFFRDVEVFPGGV